MAIGLARLLARTAQGSALMLMLELAIGIALGVALIPVARAFIAGVTQLPRLLLRALLHPLAIITGLLLLGGLWSSPSCHPSPASSAHSFPRPLQ